MEQTKGPNTIHPEGIIHRLKQDDKTAVDDLFAFYYPRLYQFSKSILKMESEIEDVLQEVFLKIWLNRHKIQHTETFNAYIYTITKHEVLNLIRSKLKDHNFREQLYLYAVAEEYQFQSKLEFEEIKSGIDRIVSNLPEKRQQIFILSRTNGLSNKEIAQQLDDEHQAS